MIELMVEKGKLVPAGSRDIDALRDMKLAVGEVVHAKIYQPRNPRFFRLAHQLGQLVRQNIPSFENLSGHQVLKRLQFESGVECDLMGTKVPNVGMVEVRIPKSLSFDSMDEVRFKALMSALCQYIATEYWPECTPEQIEQMAGAMIDT